MHTGCFIFAKASFANQALLLEGKSSTLLGLKPIAGFMTDKSDQLQKA